MLKFAIDFGNGFVKAMNEKRSIIAPSTIAEKKELGSGSVADLLDNTDLGVQVYKSKLDDSQSYIWGSQVEEQTNNFRRTGISNDRYTNMDFKLLCEFVLAELASDFTESEAQDVYLVTGMPSSEIGTDEEDIFYMNLKGKHLIERNGKEMVVNVKELKIVEQPIGTLIDLYMSEDGKMNKSLKTEKIVVLDFGAGTTIIDTFLGLRRLENESDVEYKGINDIYKSIVKQMNSKEDILPLVKEGFENQTYSISVNGRDVVPFEQHAKEEIKNHLNTALYLYNETIGGLDVVNTFIITGGGLNIMKDAFKENANRITDKIKVTYVEDSQQSNVRGFYKLCKVLSEK